MNTQQTTEIKDIAALLFEKYGAVTISTENTAEATTRSAISLTRDRASGIGIPYVKLGAGSGSDRVMYSIFDIAKFIVSRKQKVME